MTTTPKYTVGQYVKVFVTDPDWPGIGLWYSATITQACGDGLWGVEVTTDNDQRIQQTVDEKSGNIRLLRAV